MADLRTRYLGLELRSPLVASSSPLTGTLDGLLRLEAAGAGAVGLPSLFEEDLAEEARRVDALLATGATGPRRAGYLDRAGYGAGPGAYLSLISQAKAAPSIPVVASLNGVSRGGWVRYASRPEQAGTDALELNLYYVSSRPGLSASEVEWHYLDVVQAVRQATRLPLAVKLSPYFSSLVNMADQLVEAGAKGLVLFNRRCSATAPTICGRWRPACATGWTATTTRRSSSSAAGRANDRFPDPAAFERANYTKTLTSHPVRAR